MLKDYRILPSAEILWELFEYRPLTGELVWKKQLAPRGRVGSVAGYKTATKGVEIRIKGVLYKGHRCVWKWITGEELGNSVIDHTDRNPCNNCFWNLRIVTQMQNTWNTRSRNKFGHKGVSRNSNGTFFARIRCGETTPLYLGAFSTPAEAAQAYSKAAAQLHGQYACIDTMPS